MRSAQVAATVGAVTLLVTGLSVASLTTAGDFTNGEALRDLAIDAPLLQQVVPPVRRADSAALPAQSSVETDSSGAADTFDAIDGANTRGASDTPSRAPQAAAPAPPIETALPAYDPSRGSADGDFRPGRVLRRICRITAYHDRGRTAAGVPSGVGQCAAPGDIPFGARVYIPALDRTFIVTDRTHKRFRNNTIDIFIASRRACKQFGLNFEEVIITLPADEGAVYRYGAVEGVNR